MVNCSDGTRLGGRVSVLDICTNYKYQGPTLGSSFSLLQIVIVHAISGMKWQSVRVRRSILDFLPEKALF